MHTHSIYAIINAADEAINREDFDSLMDFYTEDATLVVVPGKVASGKEEIRKAFVAIAEHFNHTLFVQQGDMVVIEAGDTALAITQTNVRANMKSGAPFMESRSSTYVFKECADGQWRCIIDNSYGAALLKHLGN